MDYGAFWDLILFCRFSRVKWSKSGGTNNIGVPRTVISGERVPRVPPPVVYAYAPEKAEGITYMNRNRLRLLIALKLATANTITMFLEHNQFKQTSHATLAANSNVSL